MNKLVKILLAILGACNAVFSLFIPISIALLLIVVFNFGQSNSFMVVGLGILSTIYRAVDIGFVRH